MKMKIGITEVGYHMYGDERFKILREHGYEAVDYNLSNTDRQIFAVSDAEFESMLLKEKALADEAGIEIAQVHGPWRWPPRDYAEEDRAERMEKMKKSLWGTSILGCRYWVIHPIMPFSENDEGHAEETREMNLSFMGELLREAKKYGITICFENMPMRNLSLGSPEATLGFVKEMNDENFKMCLDLGHMTLFPQESAADFVRKHADDIPVFHIHDSNGWADLHLMPYYGVTDWDDFGKALKETGFSGVFSLEPALAKNMPRDLFEKMSRLLCEIAKRVCGD